MLNQLFVSAFYSLDVDGNGTLSADELMRFGKHMVGPSWSDAMLEGYFKHMDTDGSGEIELDEFVKFCEQTVRNGSDDKAIPVLLSSFLKAQKYHERSARLAKRRAALQIDKYCRVLVPLVLFSCMWSVFRSAVLATL